MTRWRRRGYIIETKCTWCGKPYKAKSRKTRYCSDSCKLKAFRNRKRITETVKG
jgi:predicted nucleic acid-binding Zn ribbon protein